MSRQAEIIASYITQVGDLQRQRQEVLADDELKRIALELGLKPSDIARADQAADEHLTRAAGYSEHSMLDDAIDELRAAVVLRPLDSAVILALAEGYAARWRANRSSDDREQADQLARQVLQMDPGSADAFALRHNLSTTNTSRSSASSASRA
ncbi:MAG: tetratricopeptide (TPR) repeat protein, partial [Myxococcota bacterium]